MTYDYVCTACQHEWEAEQRISEAPLTQCPACGKNSARRQVSGGQGFILKGGGWYADGYGSKGSGKADAKSEAKSDGKSTAKSEAKAETKTETKSEKSGGTSDAAAPAPKADKPEKKNNRAA